MQMLLELASNPTTQPGVAILAAFVVSAIVANVLFRRF